MQEWTVLFNVLYCYYNSHPIKTAINRTLNYNSPFNDGRQKLKSLSPFKNIPQWDFEQTSIGFYYKTVVIRNIFY